MIVDRNALWRIRLAAERLHHRLGDWQPTSGAIASAECLEPGCNMGVSVDLHAYPSARGSAVTFECPTGREKQ